mmetsp:Transcript_27426/g.56170  ORF Transcript_27426/g.56170 Transcript_27426/m.56170 type:complete len:376 (-) Transcript_27426:357-1484(-)
MRHMLRRWWLCVVPLLHAWTSTASGVYGFHSDQSLATFVQQPGIFRGTKSSPRSLCKARSHLNLRASDSAVFSESGVASVQYNTMEDLVGNTPLVKMCRLVDEGSSNVVLAKLEGNNPAGSVKDRPALNMIKAAELRGDIVPGRDTLIEATSGNTGIALAMAAAVRGYKMILIMPAHMSEERRATMRVYGAEIVSVSKEGGMEEARDLALKMEREGRGIVLNQFSNADNPHAHYLTTGPEIWKETRGTITHFVSSMGTTGTIMGVSTYLKEQNPDIQIVGVEPGPGSAIPGIRKWPEEYLPEIFEGWRVDRTMSVTQTEAEEMARKMASTEGIFCGISSGGAMSAALQLSKEVQDATIVTIACDRGDRYLSTGVF